MLDPTTSHDERLLRIALAIIARPCDIAVRDCVDQRGLAKTLNILADHHTDFAQTARRGCWTRSGTHLHTSPEKLLSAASELTEHAVIPGDLWWPGEQLAGLGKLGVAEPRCLWIKTRPRADPESLWGKAIAVIGTSDHTGHGYEATLRITRDLAGAGYPIVTLAHPEPHGDGGLAATAARTAAATSNGTSLVIGTEPVTAPLAVGGAACQPDIYLTTTPDGVPEPGREVLEYHALLQIVLTRASLIVETGTEPHVAAGIDAAHSLGKLMFALPGPALSPASRYCHRLIRRGIARLAGDLYDITDDLHADAQQQLAGAGR